MAESPEPPESPEPTTARPSPWRVALTFDVEHADRPNHPDGTEAVLDTLAERDVTATHFVQGRWAQAHPVLAKRLAADGHLIGNHSHHHARMTWLSPEGLARDVRAAEQAIRRIVGHDPRPWFRCPFGDGTDDPDVLAGLDRLGYREWSWHVDSLDWQVKSTGPAVARTVVEEATAHGDGAVVLFHPWTNATRRALPQVIDGLRAAGARFVRMDELA
ncbi:polysaccharide deacetylase family protein [Rhizohabitans arisaemae]|uniref:polysaccharide deacetylase family protein n=1 Tax=Rhizohabitans arisaemae TaxID=2720610 RepID=UPI0024B045F0|nr:polysaccharide deacetylase family protein [Rhizohabitans arisaemae]